MAKNLYWCFQIDTMKKLWIIALAGCFAACNNNADGVSDTANDTNSTRPRDVNEGVPNNLRISGDSAIVPDTNNIGPDPSAGVDTLPPRFKKDNHNKDNNNKQKEGQ
jgi:hypothetical protein